MHPILVDFGNVTLGPLTLPLRITSYGAAMVLAMLVGWLVVRRLGRESDPRLPWQDLYLGVLVAGLVGAKLLLALVRLPDLLAGRVALGAVLAGGGVWLGGMIGALGYALWFFRRHRVDAGRAANVLFVAAPLGHAIGRIGCLLAGCCYGAACSLPWAITYHDPVAQRLSGTPLGVPLHPSPLYEAAAELINFLLCWRLWRRRPAPWAVPALWLALYGGERFALEFLRGDPRGAWLGLSTSQWLALGMLAAAAWLWRTRVRRHPATAP
jgi:phosphatidylglycerol:prolipoprotein diacylglycerol transferase